MDTRTAFWEMVLEIGSSPEEFNRLCITPHFKDVGLVKFFCTRIDKNGEVELDKNASSSLDRWSFIVRSFNGELNLHDPDSFDKLEKYINRVRQNRATNKVQIDAQVAFVEECKI